MCDKRTEEYSSEAEADNLFIIAQVKDDEDDEPGDSDDCAVTDRVTDSVTARGVGDTETCWNRNDDNKEKKNTVD